MKDHHAHQHAIIVEGKQWIPSLQDWSWIVTILWMGIANLWKPFGLFGFVCMFTPILIAASGRGKMHCSRICPRGSLIGKVGARLSLGLPRPAFMRTGGFRLFLWALMMGSFFLMLVLVIPKGLYATGHAVLIFMEIATGLALLAGILFQPRTWCTFCPMGTTTSRIRRLVRWKKQTAQAKDEHSSTPKFSNRTGE